jgi:hypothetical protein
MISPVCTNGHDITVILLNVALNTNNLIFYLFMWRFNTAVGGIAIYVGITLPYGHL